MFGGSAASPKDGATIMIEVRNKKSLEICAIDLCAGRLVIEEKYTFNFMEELLQGIECGSGTVC
jgi:hypothetical protein